jgi:hypothetical protein
MVGRAVLCTPPRANAKLGAHGVTRPAREQFVFIRAHPRNPRLKSERQKRPVIVTVRLRFVELAHGKKSLVSLLPMAGRKRVPIVLFELSPPNTARYHFSDRI